MNPLAHFFVSKNLRLFFIPGTVLFTLIVSTIIRFIFDQEMLSTYVLLGGIALGSWQLFFDSFESLRKKSFALDYIAILAILTGVITGNFFVAGVIVLMMSGGNTLENFAQQWARRALTSLSNRIPHDVQVAQGDIQITQPIEKTIIGSEVLVRKGEVVPLDGVLLSDTAMLDESSLTGEPYPVTKETGSPVRSGTLNTGEVFTFRTTVEDKNSTYRHIIQLVEQAQNEKTPFLQLADKLSGWFTVVTLGMAGIAYFISRDVNQVLAVLVIATPCPLILATPIALIGGMNAAARERIIFKRLSALEILSGVKAIIFDKTGTLTFGVPKLTHIEIKSSRMTEDEVLALAGGLEKNSFHPFAKAILKATKQKKLPLKKFESVEEEIGKGVRGTFQGRHFELKKEGKMSEKISLLRDGALIATLQFTDVLKPSSAKVLHQLKKEGIELSLYTGDTKKRVDEFLPNLPEEITVKTNCSPEDKRQGVQELKKQGKLTAMVGDGINDAPALALADVGLVFSHEEHTAASEAADVILLNGNFESVLRARQLSRHTLHIAKQSMYIGIGLSFFGMVLALAGILSPLAGAISQEIIDVTVILNALRAALPSRRQV